MSVSEELEKRLRFARLLAQEAGELTLKYFRQAETGFERKADDSPVTIADREAELLLRRKVSEAYPADGIVGEEFGEKDGQSSFRLDL